MLAASYIGNKQFELTSSVSIPPKADEVRLQVRFVGICGTDMHIYHGVMDSRVAPPKVIGHEMSGIVAEIGANVTDVKVGDRVTVRPLDYCSNCPACDAGHEHICQNLQFMGIDSPGAFQQFWTVKARTLHKLPDNISLQQGALIEPLAVACHDIERARLTAGETAVILGGGPIGLLVAQVAKSMGANVILSEVNPNRLAFAEQMGIATINPIEQDLAQFVDQITQSKGADVVFEVSGVQAAIDVMTEIASVRGRICMVAIHSEPPKVDLFKFFWKELELLGARVYKQEDFEKAIELLSNNKVNLDQYVTSISSLDHIQSAFQALHEDPQGMKALISIGE